MNHLLCIWLIAVANGVSAMPSKRRRTFCNSCEKVHTDVFHQQDGEDYTFCHGAYMACSRGVLKGEPYHPTWLHMVDSGLAIVDSTGHLIHALVCRGDARALASVGQCCLGTSNWKETADRIFLCGFMLQLYWSFPMQWLWTMISEIAPCALTAAALRLSLNKMLRFYKPYRVLEGVLRFAAKRGLKVIKNPSERLSGSVRFRRLSSEIKRWRDCANRLATATGDGDLGELFVILKEAGLKSYNGSNNYANHRLLRGISVFLGVQYADSESNWKLRRSMSKHVAESLRSHGLWTYSEALRFRDAIRSRKSLPHYSLDDLICFVCLLYSDRARPNDGAD